MLANNPPPGLSIHGTHPAAGPGDQTAADS